MVDNEKIKWAVQQLQQKQQELQRLPKKDDFDDVIKSQIKAFLGPWPRALEQAGLKDPRIKQKSKKKKSTKSQKIDSLKKGERVNKEQ